MTATNLLHIGYMKTATTYLQAHVFNNTEAGFAVPLDGKGRGFLVQNIVLSDGFTFDSDEIAEQFRKAAEPVVARGLVPVWSDETIVGEPVTRRYDAHSNALRVHQALPDAHVLITIREQKALAYAMYVEYMRQGGLASVESFFGTGNEPMAFSPILRSDYLYYDRVVAFYQKLYGADRVLVLPQELLANDRDRYFKWLSTFTGKDINTDGVSASRTHKTLGATANRFRYFVNRLRSPHPLTKFPNRWERGLDRLLFAVDRLAPEGLNKKFEASVRQKISDRYDGEFSESNKRLSDLIGLDLSDYGYD